MLILDRSKGFWDTEKKREKERNQSLITLIPSR
jgi:hypothetical protein